MTNAMNAGRTVGVLLIVQMTAGYVTNFVLLGAATAPPGFLVNAAPHATTLGAAALLGMIAGGCRSRSPLRWHRSCGDSASE